MDIFNIGILGGKKGTGTENSSKSVADKQLSVPEDLSVMESKVPVGYQTSSVVAKPISSHTSSVVKEDATDNSVKSEVTVTEVKEKSQRAPEPRKIVKVCKAGVEHARFSVNNQDFVFSFMNLKAVSDGCGSGKHSEIGSHLFGQLFAREVSRFIGHVNTKNVVKLFKYIKGGNIQELAEHLNKGEIPEEAFLGIVNAVFERMLSICNETAFIFENYCFTILACFEYENEFVVYSCGDGFIIKEDFEGITFDKLDDGEYPAYYVYNWVDPSSLKDYKEGVEFKVTRYSKTDYINVGVASDGLRFFDDLYDPEKYKFQNNLSIGKGPQIEMLIIKNNRDYSTFKDDISICF